MSSVAVFGGTTEGRILAAQLADSGITVCAFVATGYGEDLIEPQSGISVRTGRLDCDEMISVFKRESFDAVIDATHPYAVQVTENLISATRRAGVFYLRILRDKTDYDGSISAKDAGEAAELLNRMNGRILLTTGSKSLEAFTVIEGWQSRLFARVLPSAEVMLKCVETGFPNRNLICMQGPFTHEMNVATIKMLGIDIIVTKDSGDTGGFPEKLSAAKECGTKLIIIRRPGDVDSAGGVSAEAALDILENVLGNRLRRRDSEEENSCHRFPVFIPLKNENVLIVGGGEVASRRARVLLDFGASVTVVAPEISSKLRGLLDRITWKPELYREISGNFALVIAATNNRSVNKQIGEDAKKIGISVSVADSKEESSFWFPAIARGGGLIAGIVSESGNHSAVKKAAEKVRKVLEENP